VEYDSTNLCSNSNITSNHFKWLNGRYVKDSSDIGLGSFPGADMTFKVIEGHLKWHGSIENIRLSINVPTTAVSCTVSKIASY